MADDAELAEAGEEAGEEELAPSSTTARPTPIKTATPKAALQTLDTAAVPELALQHDLGRVESAALIGDIGEKCYIWSERRSL